MTGQWWRSTRSRASMYALFDTMLDDGQTVLQISTATGVAETTIRRYRQTRRGHSRTLLGRPLSRQQKRVLARMAAQDEPSTQRAAESLGITRSAVEQTLSRVYQRLGVHTLLGAYRVYVVEQDRRLPHWEQV